MLAKFEHHSSNVTSSLPPVLVSSSLRILIDITLRRKSEERVFAVFVIIIDHEALSP